MGKKHNHDAPMKRSLWFLLCGLLAIQLGSVAALGQDAPSPKKQEAAEVKACAEMAFTGFRPIADTRAQRFQGKVTELTAICRGGQKAVQFRMTPWVDFTNYWGTGDLSSLPKGYLSTSAPQFRGVSGALLDLEYQRIELIKFNLFDNNGTYQDYVAGRGRRRGRGRSRHGRRCGCRRAIPTTLRSAAMASRFARAS